MGKLSPYIAFVSIADIYMHIPRIEYTPTIPNSLINNNNFIKGTFYNRTMYFTNQMHKYDTMTLQGISL